MSSEEMVSVTWILILIMLALLITWLGVIFLGKRSQAHAAEAILLQELRNQGIELSPEELRVASKNVFRNTNSEDTRAFLERKLHDLQPGAAPADTQGKINKAIENAQGVVNSEANKASGSLYKSSMTTNLIIGAVIIVCLGVIFYLLFATDKGYYGYFLGAVIVLAPLFALNFYNTYFFIPLLICLVLSGLFIGLGAQEVIYETTLASGGERPT